MQHESTNDFSNLENQFNNWLGSTDQTRKVACKLANQELTVIFNQGHWIYPSFESVPKFKMDTVNVITADPEVKHVFESSLKRLSEHYQFPGRRLGTFKLRFFADADALDHKIAAENRQAKEHSKPGSCTIL